MRILIYLAHPAQYHFFKFIVKDLQRNGHTLKMVIKSKDILEKLLQEDGIPYDNILPEGRNNKTLGMILSMLKRDVRLYKIVREFKPDILLGSDSCTAHVGWFVCKPSITFAEDDYSVYKKLAWMMLPFSSCLVSPMVCNSGPFHYKKVGYEGYMKLAYLHPSVFTPDKQKVKDFSNGKPYCILRMVKLSAHHDCGIKGLNYALVKEIITKIKLKGYSIFLDSEDELEGDLVSYRLEIKKSHMHDLMAFATVIISDSQSLSVEAAMLGVPSIRFNDFAGKISVLEELEHSYGLTFGIRTDERDNLFLKLDEILNMENLREEFQQRRLKMLSEKINVKAFMIWLIENYPESRKLVKQNNQLLFQFK